MISLVVGIGMLLIAAASLALRYVPIPGHRTLYAVIAAPYLSTAVLVALLLFVWGRQWVLLIVAAALTVAIAVPQAPWYLGERTHSRGVDLRVMTLNMLYGGADPQAIVAVASDSADIVLLQELTPEAVRGLTAAGLDREFPHSAIDARPEAAGAAIYSRHPLSATQHAPADEGAMVRTSVQPYGARYPLTLLSMHLAAPWPQSINNWHKDFSTFPSTMVELSTQAGAAPILIGGDFNATTDMRPYRDLLTNGYRDAAEQAGAGRTLTYPANRRILPPLLGIDHFLTRNCTATSVHTVEIAGTDHLGVITTVVVPMDPSLS